MKQQLLSLVLGLVTVVSISGCTTVVEKEKPTTHTTTTTSSESVMRRPAPATSVESTTVRSY